MNRNGISKGNHQENTSSNSKLIKVLNSKENPNQGEVSDKQGSKNSNNLQNKFDLPSFKCEACSYESIWKHAVKRHQQIHYRGQTGHEESKKLKYQCRTCSFTTNNLTILKDHLKLHASPKTKIEDLVLNEQYPSSLIVTKQKQIEGYNNNQEQKLNKIVFSKCNLCGFKTNYKEVFECHKKVHLPRKGDGIFQCELCSFRSVYKQSFARHMRNMHENELSKDDNLYCYCGITAVSEEELQEHLKRHEIKNSEEKLDHNSKKNDPLNQQMTNQKDDQRHDLENQNNNLSHQSLKPSLNSQEVCDSLQDKFPPSDATLQTSQIRKPIARTRRGKYSDVPVKTTKNGLFECNHCSYQTAIRTALVKHQTNHLKNSKS